MKPDDHHLSDALLLRDVDGELTKKDKKHVCLHLEVCRTCRTRRSELESAIVNLVHVHQQQFKYALPPVKEPRALLQARLRDLICDKPRFERSAAENRPNWIEARKKYFRTERPLNHYCRRCIP
jgi:anti-sigma factor RsiW